MPVSNPTIRRYTPPTCTLEVLAQSSALSQWMGKSVLKELSFELRFDDPQLSDDRKVTIRGDREQLEALCVTVTNYVQEFLQMSPESFWANFSSTRDTSQASDETLVPDFTSSSTATTTIDPLSARIPSGEIHIQPNSHLKHNLFLGSLANSTSGGVVELSLLQLFDLATALDEYSTDVIALPDLNSHRRASPIPVWAPVAAVLAIGVGLAPITWQYANRLRQEQQTAGKSKSSSQTIALQDSPPSTLSSPLPTLSPSNNNLITQPLPTFGANFPLPSSTSAPSAQPFPILPPNPPTGSQPQIPSVSLSSPTSTFPTSSKVSPNVAILPKNALPSSGTALTIPSTKIPPLASSPQSTASLNKTPGQRVTLQPNAKQSALTSASRGEIPALSANSKNPSSNPELGSSSGIPAVPPPLPNIPSNLSSARGINSSTEIPPLNATTPNDTDALIAKLRQGRERKNNVPTEVAASSNNDRLFDTLQVSEAREFLTQRWEPPSGLKQAIEYSLVVGVDGSLERIMPLGKAARDFVDRTGMPLIGEPFVSPSKNGQSVKIRAVFNPNGKVQTFPEKD
ncbi:DUF4335 domain-containing protein [Scytonema sp. NUACC26]|uniref:DUF4335 domain-containing protein n=1 Tax=Scytonema sp. NUACC26 TaxID=3140176 RepID=UPI0034DBDA49